MKKSFLSLISVALVYVFSATVVSCSNYESPLTGQKVNDIVMEETEGFYDVTFGNADLSNIKALSSETWCTPTVNGRNIRISVSANDTYGERKSMITLIDSKDASNLSFYVIQKQNNAIIAPKGLAIPAKSGSYILNVQSNVYFEVEIPADCNWLKTGIGNSRTRGLHNSDVILIATENLSDEHRYVTINLVNNELGINNPVQIYQLTPGESQHMP